MNKHSLGSRVRRAQRRSSTRGYTAVEVFLALTVLLISTAGVMSMQKASIQGNLDARKLDLANSIARTQLDRLATDATLWNTPSGLIPTVWVNAAYAVSPQFIVPPVTTNGSNWSAAFDILGRDLLSEGDPTAAFCTKVKVDLVANDQQAVPQPIILRATVLVFWPKSIVGSVGAPNVPLCGGTIGDIAAYETSNPGTYHMLYVTEGLRRSS